MQRSRAGLGRFITVFTNFLHLGSMSRTPPSNQDAAMPTTLAGFGYGFNEAGQLRQVDPATGLLTDKPYDFNVRPSDVAYNQLRYEALGDVITEHVYELLEQADLEKIHVPDNNDDVPPERSTFVFTTRRDVHNARKLLVLINGSGVVRAGQWARSLIINKSLDQGTQLPYIRRARALGYDVLIMNTNDNRRNGKPIAGSRDPVEHATTVWRQLLAEKHEDGEHGDNSAAAQHHQHIAFAAHSYGGIIVQALSRTFREQFVADVFAIAYTDSVTGSSCKLGNGSAKDEQHFQAITRNYVASDLPLDEPIKARGGGIAVSLRSAGHPKHEVTSWSCLEALFTFLEERHKNKSRRTDSATSTRTDL